MAILVLGGAGYIGSHTVAELIRKGNDVVVLDTLEKGHRRAVHEKATFYQGSALDAARLDAIFAENAIEAVMHFCAYIEVGESMLDPARYYRNNVIGGLVLLDAMRKANVNKIVFSSTAAVYGEPEIVPIPEDLPKRPKNPYGETKLAFERALAWYSLAYGISFVALRYFNASGAHLEEDIGEDHRPESHLIPLILQVALGKRDSIAIFGDDYPTKDGTCVRDYVHVCDIASAHMLALTHLLSGGENRAYNLGNGKGFSVKEALAVARAVTGHAIPAVTKARREGDPAALVASSEAIRNELGWTPRASDLETIIASAWRWHTAHPNGYAD